MAEFTELPQDFFVPIENNENFLGRITLNLDRGKYTAEIAIVQSESKKIFQYIETLYGFEEGRDAIDQAVMKLGKYLRKLERD